MFGTLGDFFQYKQFPQYSKHEHDTLLHLEPQGDKTVDIQYIIHSPWPESTVFPP